METDSYPFCFSESDDATHFSCRRMGRGIGDDFGSYRAAASMFRYAVPGFKRSLFELRRTMSWAIGGVRTMAFDVAVILLNAAIKQADPCRTK